MSGSLAYGRLAALYDAASGEWPVYGAGRRAGLRLLRPRRGWAVLDLGCGTGLNLAPLLRAVGREGAVVGVDASTGMLAAARRRVRRLGAEDRVRLIEADATRLDPEAVRHALRDLGHDGFDALVATYALSVMDDRRAAWTAAIAVLRPGGRALVVDMQRPTGAARGLAPLAVAACALGGADIDAHPWTALERDGDDVRRTALRGGHVVAVAGIPAA